MYQVNVSRLKHCMERAENGEELTIGFLGGSITQGSLASAEEHTYAYRVFTWWERTFPKAGFHYVNAGIGGTSSHYGAARAVPDLLMYQPDFVVVDFSVNDEPSLFFAETYEGVIRQLLDWPSAPAVLLLNNVFYDTGENAQEYHNSVGAWYQIPYVSAKDTIYQEIQAGRYSREEVTPDGLHPNDRGHELAAGLITELLEDVRARVLEKNRTVSAKEGKTRPGWEVTEEPYRLPPAMTENAYQHAKRLTIREICPVLEGFRADTEEKKGHLDHFKNGWIGKQPGDRICFELEASCIAVQYRKTIQRPAAAARLILDQDQEHPVILDGNFGQDWGDCLYLHPVLHHGTPGLHRVEIEIMEKKEKEADVTPFYLMALITDGA